jgi:hypothetical protein
MNFRKGFASQSSIERTDSCASLDSMVFPTRTKYTGYRNVGMLSLAALMRSARTSRKMTNCIFSLENDKSSYNCPRKSTRAVLIWILFVSLYFLIFHTTASFTAWSTPFPLWIIAIFIIVLFSLSYKVPWYCQMLYCPLWKPTIYTI